MSTHPSLESRVKALEHRQYSLETHTEELANGIATSVKHLSADMTASFKQLAEYQIKTEGQIDTRFNLVDARLDRIEATMATKEDLAAMENRILDAFKQLIATINIQRPPSQ